MEVDLVQEQDSNGSNRNESSLAPPSKIDNDTVPTKRCAYCNLRKPLAEFKRRSGKRRGGSSRRGACKACREKRREQAPAAEDGADVASADRGAAGGDNRGDTAEAVPGKKRRRKRRPKAKAVKAKAGDRNTATPAAAEKSIVSKPIPIKELQAVGLVPARQGFIRMRGKTDNGRRWYQEIDPELALTLVQERAAVVVNRQTIRRLYSNKEFRRMILERDQYTCRFCGKYGDTIDHMLPRAKGGHTTPDNCICACNLCNQLKADQDLDAFIREDD